MLSCLEGDRFELRIRNLQTAIELAPSSSYPAHSIIFNGMHRAIASRAEALRGCS
jgi:hypothetical protein